MFLINSKYGRNLYQFVELAILMTLIKRERIVRIDVIAVLFTSTETIRRISQVKLGFIHLSKQHENFVK